MLKKEDGMQILFSEFACLFCYWKQQEEDMIVRAWHSITHKEALKNIDITDKMWTFKTFKQEDNLWFPELWL